MRPKNSNNFYNARVLYPKERVLILRNKTEWPRGKIVTFLMQFALCFLSHQFHHKFWPKPSPQLFISLIIFHPQNCTTKLLSSPSKRLKVHSPSYFWLPFFFFLHLPRHEHTKLLAQFKRCELLESVSYHKGFLCYNPSSNVVFVENQYFESYSVP